MRQSVTGGPNKLPSIIAAAFVLSFLVTSGQGKCRGEEKRSTIRVAFGKHPSLPRGYTISVGLGHSYRLKGFNNGQVQHTEYEKTLIDRSSTDPIQLSFPTKDEIAKETETVKLLAKFLKEPVPELGSLVIYLSVRTMGGYDLRAFRLIEGTPGETIWINYDIEPDKTVLFGEAYNLKIKSCVEITLNKTLRAVEVKEQVVQAVADSPQVKKEEHTVRHSVSVQKSMKIEGEMKAQWAFLEAGIKGTIERSENRTYENSHTSTREVVIPGNTKKYKIVWIETYRTGKVVTKDNLGKKTEVPFEFREGWDLQTKEVKE